MADELRHKDLWSGMYRGVAFEIAHWDVRPECTLGIWNFYLFIREDMVPEANVGDVFLAPIHDSGRWGVRYAYYDSILAEIEWHGNMTFYEKRGGADGSKTVAVGGCDYNHLFDQGVTYRHEGVAADARRAIDDLRRLIPGLRWPCD